jgi:hypothetical protein
MYLHTSTMSISKTKQMGRPKTKAGVRNFRFTKSVDDFLEDEKTRANRDYTLIVERALMAMSRLKPSARDAEYRRLA